MRKKIILSLVVASLCLASYFAVAKYRSTPETELKIATVKKDDLKIGFTIDGKTVIEKRDLKFNVSGKVAEIKVKEGQSVKKGQLLALLDSSDVQKNLERDLKDYLIARNTFDQTNEVTYPDGAANDTLKRILENTQFNLDKSVLDVEIRNETIKESRLYSPMSGVVSIINIKEGEIASSQNTNPIMTITTPGSLVFEAYAEDTEVLKISKEQMTKIRIDAIPNVSFGSELDFISNLATIDANGLASYKVRATMKELREYNILDGMPGQIEFITKEKLGVMTVPNTAIVRRENKGYVRKILDGKITEVVVETGFTDGKNVETISGLAVGESVLIP